MKTPKRRHRMARFNRLKQLREDLGWEVADLVARLNGKPSASSVYRLEDGHAIRYTSVRRIFDAINHGYNSQLSAQDCIIDV